MTVREVYISEGVKQGMQRGVQQGIQQGIQQGAQNIALKMLRGGMPKETICRYAEISMADLDALEREQLIETEAQH